MMTFVSKISILLLLFYATTLQNITCNNLREVRCNEKDQQTLLIFKEGVLDPFNRLTTWSSEKDCCAWKGVQCDNTTSRVTELDLSNQSLEGAINLSLLELEFLNHLDLSFNEFNAISVPSIHNYVISDSNLHYLDLAGNRDLSMDNLHWLSQLSFLKYLNLGSINLQKETTLLQLLAMLPSLSELHLEDCALNITQSLEQVNFTSLVTLDLSYNYFSSKSLYCLLNLSSGISYLDLSFIDLSGNFDLQWLSQLSSLKYLDLGGIDLHTETNWLLVMPPSLSNLYMRGCQLTNISPSLKYVNLTSLVTLDLSYNYFKSELPHWLYNFTSLVSLDLSFNNFSSKLPHWLYNLTSLVSLDLSACSLHGEIASSLFNNQNLKKLDLSQNMFSGTIPINMSQNLQVVILRSNQFEGSIPPQLFNLSALFYLDLAQNKLSGSIPQGVYNTTGMITDYEGGSTFDDGTINLFTKGEVYKYNLHSPRRTIDLSVNNLSGEIPSELFGLILVQTLNLSYNHLTGTIPKTIGGMKNLESLDLSNNKLFGEIPQNMATLSFLEYLNLSCNNFTGQIPTGTQLQSFDASSYVGNPELCGAPLSNCSTEEKNPVNVMQHTGNEDGGSQKESLYLGMGVGFAVGFLGICGSLLLLREWRHKYYRFLNRVFDQLYVTYMVKFNNFLNREANAS